MLHFNLSSFMVIVTFAGIPFQTNMHCACFTRNCMVKVKIKVQHVKSALTADSLLGGGSIYIYIKYKYITEEITLESLLNLIDLY